MKRIISMLLALVILLTIPANTYAQSLTNQIGLIKDGFNIIMQEDGFEVIEVNGFLYVYLENDENVVTMTLDKNNKFIDGYIKEHGVEDRIVELQPENEIYIENIKEYASKISLLENKSLFTQNEIKINIEVVENHNYIQHEEVPSDYLQPLSEESDKAVQKVIDRYGSPTYDQYLTNGTYNGRTGYLYFTRTFGAYKALNKYIAAGLTLSAISALLALPASGVKAIIALIAGAGGTLISSKAETVRKYIATCYHKKEVKVGSIYPYRSLKDYIGEVFISSTGVTEFQYKKTKSNDNIYFNNQAIIRRGCELY